MPIATTTAQRLLFKPGYDLAAQLLADNPEEIIIDDPNAEIPHPRQAGTLGEETKLMNTVREQAEQSLFYFNLVFMGGHTLMQQKPQGIYCDFLQTSPPRRKLLLAPRGTLKTTITKGLVLHFFIQPLGHNIYFPHGRIGHLNHDEGRSTRVLLASKGSDLSSSKLIELRTWIEKNNMLRAFWPQCFWHDPSRQATAWNNEHIFLPREEIFKEGSIETSGVGATVTGSHFNAAVHDDLVDEKDRYSSTTMERAYSWFLASRFLLDDVERAQEYLLGTHWNNNDVYVKIKRDGLGITHQTYSAIQEDGSALWPEVFPLSTLEYTQKDLEDSGRGDLYALNYLNDPTHASIVAFDVGRLRFFTEDDEYYYIPDDMCDMELLEDYDKGGSRPKEFLKGQKLTSEFYKQHREELAPDLRAMYFGSRHH